MNRTHYHYIGIGGMGMSGLAQIMLKLGHQVSGSDLEEGDRVRQLRSLGAEIFIGHCSSRLPKESVVVINSDIKSDNPELLEADRRKQLILHRSDQLASLISQRTTLAVAGTHGKTTTSSLLTHLLKTASMDISYSIGGVLSDCGQNSYWGEADWFVVEACESDGTFLKYHPHGAIVTNVGSDHLSHYGSMEEIEAAFVQFLKQVKDPRLCFWCGDDPCLQMATPLGHSYGFSPDCKWQIIDQQQHGWMQQISIRHGDKIYKDIEIKLVGKHNALNAAAVFGLGMVLGISERQIRLALSTFPGVRRRCQHIGEWRGVSFIDDYAHHPTEIRTTLQGIRHAIGPDKRLIALFQPHRFTRTMDCLGLYGTIFDAANEVIVTEIYSAHDPPIPGISHELVLQEIKDASTTPCSHVLRAGLPKFLETFLKPGDLCITLGAGDITKLSHELITTEKHEQI